MINKDIYSFIDFYLNNSKATDKEKTKKYLDPLFSIFLNCEYNLQNVDDVVYDSNMIDRLEELEKILYPKSFSYAASAREKYEKSQFI